MHVSVMIYNLRSTCPFAFSRLAFGYDSSID